MAPRGALRGRAALITGGASGIGRATSSLFAAEGAAVAVFDRDEAGGRAVVRALTEGGGRALLVAGDVTRDADCRRAVAETLLAFGRLDVLFNNAGIIRRAAITDTSEEDWDRTMAVNVKSIFLLSRCAIPAMEKAGGGVIINTASNWGLVGGPRAAAYCASKGAVVLLTKAMAIDHGRQGIRVNCICPGDVETPMLPEDAKQRGMTWEEYLKGAANRPLGRIGQPEEIAKAALFLASDDSSFMTGSTLVVDGGGSAD